MLGALGLLAAAAASLLSPADLDPARVLPPPPAAGSAQAMAERAELRDAGSAATPETLAAAKHDGDTKDASIFAAAIGSGFDLARLPATAQLMALVRTAEKDAVARGKTRFLRERPYVAEPSIAHCAHGDDEPLSSYPSGHTTMAYAMAEVLARLIPARAGPILARAADYAQSRIVCGVHFRSDLTAGETLGALVAERLMRKRAFKSAFRHARAELREAKIAA